MFGDKEKTFRIVHEYKEPVRPPVEVHRAGPPLELLYWAFVLGLVVGIWYARRES